MKKIVYLATIFTFLLTGGCSKNTDEQKGYYKSTVYKNTLSLPVSMQHIYPGNSGSAPIQLIEPGNSIKYTYYVCLRNCPQVELASSLMAAPPIATKIYIDGKVKTDYDCGRISDAEAKATCENDLISLYNPKRWIESRNRDTTFITYNIDKADSLEAK